ncbi:hypothetical protein Lal_00011056 [Lupinus albus]|nr:hypothetical protein Lal_00011056 [Lupinus albus]
MCRIPCSLLDKEQPVPSSLSLDLQESHSCNLSFRSSSRSQSTIPDEVPLSTGRTSIIWLHKSSPIFCFVGRRLPDSRLSFFRVEAERSICANPTSNNKSSALLLTSFSNELHSYTKLEREETIYASNRNLGALRGIVESSRGKKSLELWIAYIRAIKNIYDVVKIVIHQGSTLSSCLFTFVLDMLTEHIQEQATKSLLFADNCILVGELREELNRKLEMWRQVLEVHIFRIFDVRLHKVDKAYSRCKDWRSYHTKSLNLSIFGQSYNTTRN